MGIQKWKRMKTLRNMLMCTQQWRDFERLCAEYRQKIQDANGFSTDEHEEVLRMRRSFASHTMIVDIHLVMARLDLASELEHNILSPGLAFEAEACARKWLRDDWKRLHNCDAVFADLRARARKALGQYSNAEDDLLAAVSAGGVGACLMDDLDEAKQCRLESEAADMAWTKEHPILDVAEEYLEHWRYLEKLWERCDEVSSPSESVAGKPDESCSFVQERSRLVCEKLDEEDGKAVGDVAAD